MCLCMCVMRQTCWGGVFEPVEQPVEKPETPTTPPSTEDLLTIKIEDKIMAVVGTNNWTAITYGNGKYVAAGTGGYVTVSTDGINWTTPTKLGFTSVNDITALAYGNGKFVIITNGMYTISYDGITWSTPIQFDSRLGVDSIMRVNQLTYGNNRFVYHINGVNTLTIFDDNLNVLATPDDKFRFPVKYQDGLFRTLAVGSSNDTFVVKTSHDGINWETVSPEFTTKSYATYIRDFTYANNSYVIAYNTDIIVVTGTSCNTYTMPSVISGYTNNALKIVYCNGRFVCLTEVRKYVSLYYLLTSIDGANWSVLTELKTDSGAHWTDGAYDICAGK